MSMVLLSALLAVSMAGVAGCTKRKSKAGRSTSGTSGDRPDSRPTTARPSPSPSASDPAGATCAEVLATVVAATEVAWRFDDGQTQATDESTRKGGFRKCHFKASSTRTLPAAILVVTFYRIDRRNDSDPDRVRDLAAKNAECTERVVSPPPGTTLAVQCLQKHGGTLFNVHTTIAEPTGYVLAWTSMQPATASTALHTRARDISLRTAYAALGMI
jgi:hypothetical protein